MDSDDCIGPYQLGTCLGQGSFGAVYEATHQETGQRVALKFLHESKELEPDAQNRFVREVALLQRLEHENIVRHFEAGLHEGTIYCAMELVECGTLKQVLADRARLPWRESAEVTLQVAWALAHAHQRGCIHRDLKPANLYLSEDGMVKLGDLGLARDLEGSRLTASGHTVGTWYYMPPEQITAQAEIDGRLDLYALGCILFEMLAGHVPFDGPDFATVFDHHLESVPPRLDVLLNDCPKALADLVDALLEKRPKDRPESATVVAERLEELLSGNLPDHDIQQPDAMEQEEPQSSSGQPGPNLTKRLQTNPVLARRTSYWQLSIIVVGILAALVGAVMVLQSVK